MKAEEYLIEIDEYKSCDIGGLNEAKDLPYLKKDCFKYSTLRSPYKITAVRDNKIKIENTSYSGIIQLDSKRLHFTTKVNTNLFYMLSFLKDEKEFLYDPELVIEIKEGASFFDILGRLFLNELNAIFEKGFLKKYVRREENISFIKGKLVIYKNVQNNIRKNAKFYCSYENLTYDNLENQIILKATTLLIPLIKYNEKTRSELIRFSNLLREEVSLSDINPEDCNMIQYSRLNDYYEAIIQFSKVILQNYFIRSAHKGASKGFNFIVNMNKVYEDFITEQIKDIIKDDPEFKDYIVETQKSFDNLVKEKQIITRPDVILRKRNTNEYPLIIDAKYKRQESNTDYYQVIAYALAIPDTKACCLIYPKEEGIEDSILTLDPSRFGNPKSEIQLHAVKIDLFWNDNLEFADYIGKVKVELKEKLLSCLQVM